MVLSIKAMWHNLDFNVYWSRYSRQGKESEQVVNHSPKMIAIKLVK